MNPIETLRALADITVDIIGAVPAVQTRVTEALVYLLLALVTSESQQTVAQERVDTINTGAPILAWIGATVICVCLTVHSRVARKAMTLVAPRNILTSSTIFAGISNTLVNIHRTSPTLPTHCACAHIILIVFGFTAYTAIFTWMGGAWGENGLAIFASIRERAHAVVAVHFIHAGSFI